MNIVKQIMRATGMNQEEIIKNLASTGVASEQDIRRMVMSGDNAGLRNLANPHRDTVMQNNGLMQQARYMGAPVPKSF